MNISVLAILLLAVLQAYAAADRDASFSKAFESIEEADKLTIFKRDSSSDTTTTPTATEIVSASFTDPGAFREPVPSSSPDMDIASSAEALAKSLLATYTFDEQSQTASTHHVTSTASAHPHETGPVNVPAGFPSTGVVAATWTQCDGGCSVGYAVYPVAWPTWYKHESCHPDAALATTMVPSPTSTTHPVSIGPFDIADATDCYYGVTNMTLSCDNQSAEADCAFCAGSGCRTKCADYSWEVGSSCGW